MKPRILASLAYASLLWTILTAANCCDAAQTAVYLKATDQDTSAWPVGITNFVRVEASHVSTNQFGKIIDTDFDQAMRTNGNAYAIVYLGPGTFNTLGACGLNLGQSVSPGFRLQDHGQLRGAGQGGAQAGGTTLKLVACNDLWHGLVVAANLTNNGVISTSSDIYVRDLTIDCNGPSLLQSDVNDGDTDSDGDVLDHPWYIQGVELWGTGNMHVERVSVIDAVGNIYRDWPQYGYHTNECFILNINAVPGVSTGNVIQDCTATFYNTNGHGNCSAISMNQHDREVGSISGTISGCSVTLNGGQQPCINAADTLTMRSTPGA